MCTCVSVVNHSLWILVCVCVSVWILHSHSHSHHCCLFFSFILVCYLLLVRTGSLLFSCQPQCSAFESLLINMTVTLASQLTRHQQTISSSFMFVLCSAGQRILTSLRLKCASGKPSLRWPCSPEHFTLPQPPGMNVEKRTSRAKC